MLAVSLDWQKGIMYGLEFATNQTRTLLTTDCWPWLATTTYFVSVVLTGLNILWYTGKLGVLFKLAMVMAMESRQCQISGLHDLSRGTMIERGKCVLPKTLLDKTPTLLQNIRTQITIGDTKNSVTSASSQHIFPSTVRLRSSHAAEIRELVSRSGPNQFIQSSVLLTS